MLRPPYVRGEEALGHVFARESSSDCAAAIVNNNRRIVQSGAHCGGGSGASGRGDSGRVRAGYGPGEKRASGVGVGAIVVSAS
jgi:hypothetical protein